MSLRCLLPFLSLLVAASIAPPLPAEAADKHVVIDLDGTLIQGLSKSNFSQFSGKQVLEIDGKSYLVSENARYLVTQLALRPEVKISFFSERPADFTRKALDSITTLDGRPLARVAHRILSEEDLTVVSGNPVPLEGLASVKYRKNLRKVSDDEKSPTI